MDRLGQGGVGAQAGGHLQDRAGAQSAAAGDGHHPHGLPEVPGLEDEVQAVAIGHQDVDDDRVGLPRPHDFQTLIDRTGGHDLVIHALQHVLQMAQHQGIVLDDTHFHGQPSDVSACPV